MAIKVAKLDNIFGTNGSGERPNNVPDIGEFQNFPNLLVDGNDNKTAGVIILTGDGNYAFCENQGYFLKRLKVADREDSGVYGLIKDWWTNGIEREISVTGFCTKTNDRELLLNNIDYVEPIIQNPCRQYKLNLSSELTRHGGEDVEITIPDFDSLSFDSPFIDNESIGGFLKDCKTTPVSDSLLDSIRRDSRSPKYKRGVTIVGFLETSTIKVQGKDKVLDKLKDLLRDIHHYSLSKIGDTQEAGLGDRAYLKNKYVLTLTEGGLGTQEETARVFRLDFRNLKDIQLVENITSSGDTQLVEFQKKEGGFETLESHYNRAGRRSKDYHSHYYVLQRQVYFPYLKENGGTNDNYLYRGHLDPALLSSARAQESPVISEFGEADPLVPVYQGYQAQKLYTEDSGELAYLLPYINHLNTTFNFDIRATKSSQHSSHLKNNIPFFFEECPPEFGFLMLGEVRERTDWNWGHYKGSISNTIDVLIGLKEGGEKPTRASYDRDVAKGVKRVSQGGPNFRLLNSLYPYSGVYYFSALRDDKLTISYRDWAEGGPEGQTNGFRVSYAQEGEADFSTLDIRALTQRNIDNNVLDIHYYDQVRNDFFNRYGIIAQYPIPTPLLEGDIFFSDITAFGEKHEDLDYSYKYATQLDGYLDTETDHHKEAVEFTDKRNLLVFYGNNATKRYHLGIYNQFTYETHLADEENVVQSIAIGSSDKSTHRDITYHHISQLRTGTKGTKRGRKKNAGNLGNFKKWATTREGEQVLKNLDDKLRAIHTISTDYQRAGFQAYENPAFFKEFKTGNRPRLRQLPRAGLGFDLDEIFKLINGLSLSDNAYGKTNVYSRNTNITLSKTEQGTRLANLMLGSVAFFYSGFNPLLGIAAVVGTAAGADRLNYTDFLRFTDGSGIAFPTAGKTLAEVKYIIQEVITPLFSEVSDGAGTVGTFKDTSDFLQKINEVDLQKDIYKSLGLIDAQGQESLDLEDISDKTFELVGTGYGLYIDSQGEPHLVFKPQTVKTDIELYSKTYFRLPRTETPQQDYIDAINQKTSLQVINTNYPLDERIVFDNYATIDDEGETDTDFKVSIEKFIVTDKKNANDYYIVSYEGARQLIDAKLALPKRTLKGTKYIDLVAQAQLAFDQQKGREDYKNRHDIFNFEKTRSMEGFEFRRERLTNQYGQAIFGMAMGGIGALTTGGGFAAGLMAINASNAITQHRGDMTEPEDGHSRFLEEKAHYGNNATKYIRGSAQLQNPVNSLVASGMQLRELALQGRELEADIKQALGLFSVQQNQFKVEHIYNERQFAFQLMNLGNVYTQGEVNDRDIIDQYNEQRGLNEVHLIYKVPSQVQREGIERHYAMYGVNCQIPDVTFKFKKGMDTGTICAFGFIDKITNLWATEEKEALKTVLAAGFKILPLKKAEVRPPALPIKPGQSKIDELLQESTPEQRNILFNKLTTQLDQIAIIKHLAENTIDKNALVDIIVQYLDRTSLLARLAKSDSKEELTAFVLKLLDRIDQDEIFNEILKSKDKEVLIEEWIDKGTKLLHVLLDKYPAETIAKKEHLEKLAEKDDIIQAFRDELKDTYAKALELQSELGDKNEKLTKALDLINTQKGLIEHHAGEAKKAKDALTKETNAKLDAQKAHKNCAEEKRKLTEERDKAKAQWVEWELSSKKFEGQVKEYTETAGELEEVKEVHIRVKKSYKELEKELTETKASLEGVRKIEQELEKGDADRWATLALGQMLYKVYYTYKRAYTYIVKEQNLESYKSAYLYGFRKELNIFMVYSTSASGYEARKTCSYDRNYQGTGKFDDDTFKTKAIENDGTSGWGEGTHNKLQSVVDRGHYKGHEYVQYIGSGNIVVIETSEFNRLPRISQIKLSDNLTEDLVMSLKLSQAVGGNPTDNNGSASEVEGQKKIETYKDYMDFMGLKGDNSKKCVVPKSLLA